MFAETRQLAEEWTYRYLAAAWAWLSRRGRRRARVTAADDASPASGPSSEVSVAQVRRWAREHGLPVFLDRGRGAPR